MNNALVLSAAFGLSVGLSVAVAAPIGSPGEENPLGFCVTGTTLQTDEGICRAPATEYEQSLVDNVADLFPVPEPPDWTANSDDTRKHVPESDTLFTAAAGMVAFSLLGLHRHVQRHRHRPGCQRVRKRIRLMA